MGRFNSLLAFGFIFTILISCKSAPGSFVKFSMPNGEHKAYVIKNINIVSMAADGEIIPDATVVIIDDKISSINGSIPAKAKVIDGSRKWLIPGFIDMHVHVPTDTRFPAKVTTGGATMFFNTQDIMTPYIANGVTTILDLNSKAEHFAQRNEIAKGSVIGPRMALAALIDGGEGQGRTANNPESGRQAVRSVKAEGYEFIKLYSSLNPETYKAIVDEAYKQGLKTVGHIPNAFKGHFKDAFVPHFGMVAHAEEFSKQTSDFTDEDAMQFAQVMKENGTWLSPTLTTMKWILSQSISLNELRNSPALQYVHPLLQSKWLTANNYNRNTNDERVKYFAKLVDFHKRLVMACKKAGVPIVVGTDTGASGLIAGFSVHDELELLVAAGLTPQEALNSATRLSAEWLGIEKFVGTVEVGKSADLILLNENPLTYIKNTRKIAGVFVNGHWLSQSKIEAMLVDLSKRNNADKAKYDWKQTIESSK